MLELEVHLIRVQSMNYNCPLLNIFSSLPQVPMFNKKEENLIFSTLCEYTVPMVRAAWYLKMTAAISATMAETKTMKRRAPIDPSLGKLFLRCR